MNQQIYFRYMLLLLLLLVSSVGATATADQVVVTSGRVVYDPFGRAVKVYHPTVDSERVDSFSRAVDNVAPTRTEYDELDRPLKVTLPDGTYTTYAYSLVGNVLTVQTANLKDGGKSIEYRYDRGRLTRVCYPEHPIDLIF